MLTQSDLIICPRHIKKAAGARGPHGDLLTPLVVHVDQPPPLLSPTAAVLSARKREKLSTSTRESKISDGGYFSGGAEMRLSNICRDHYIYLLPSGVFPAPCAIRRPIHGSSGQRTFSRERFTSNLCSTDPQ